MGADAHSGAALRHRQRGGQLQDAPGQLHGVVIHAGAGQNVLAAGQPGGSGAARVGKHRFGGTGAQHAALVHHHHLRAQAVGFVPVVGDQQGGACKVGQQAAHFAFHFLAQVAVQCAEGLVQHQDLRPAHKDAGQRGTLLLSAGKLGRAAARQLFQPHGVQHFRAAGLACSLVFFCFQAAEDVLFHGHVGEQGVILEQQAHAALLGRQVDVLFTVEQHGPVQYDTALVRFDDARNAAQGHALAAAGRAQNGGGGIPGGEL